MSVALEEQKAGPGATNYGGSSRFPRSVILWLQCDKDVLNERLERRVDKMIEDGLVEELLDFHKVYNERRLEKNELPDYTRGIFQAIGFKEFHDYLILEEENRKSKSGEKLLQKCIEMLKKMNKKYAKRQLRWIKYRFLARGTGQMPPIYSLDATDISLWNEKVFAIAENIVDSLLHDRKPSFEALPVTEDQNDRKTIKKCDVCNKYCQGIRQFDEHLKSKKHFQALKLLEKKSAEEKDKNAIVEAVI